MSRAKKQSAPARNLLEGDVPGGVKLFAAIDPAARFVAPEVCQTRFAATLHPFTSEAEARAALKRAGAVL